MPGRRAGSGSRPPKPKPRPKSKPPRVDSWASEEATRMGPKAPERITTENRIIDGLKTKGKVKLRREEIRKLPRLKPRLNEAFPDKKVQLNNRNELQFVRSRSSFRPAFGALSAIGDAASDVGRAAGALAVNAPMASGPAAGRRALSAEKRRAASKDLLSNNWARDYLLGSHLSGQLETGKFDPLSLADAFLAMGIGKPVAGVRAGITGGRALLKEGGKEAVEAAVKEYGGPGITKRGIRTLKLGDKVQQLPRARSRITKTFIQRPADWTSAQLAREESKAAKLIRQVPVLRNVSAERRVPKAAGMAQQQAAARAAAPMLKHINALPDAGSPEDIAHFWWAQLPKSYRNVEGLQRVRDAQARKLERLLAESTDSLSPLRQADRPLLIEDLSTSIAQLDQIIARPPALSNKVIEAVRNLSGARKKILIEAGVLDSEKAASREGLVSGWLGLESGGEAFIGHRLAGKKIRGSNARLLPGSGTGRVNLPPGVSQENKLVLAESGRLRPSTHVAAEDWQSSQVYRSAVQARDDISEMGEQFQGFVPEDSMLVNKKGKALPPNWKTDKLPHLADASDEEIHKHANEIVRSFLAETGEEIDAWLKLVDEGKIPFGDLRIVKKDIVQRYYGRFAPAGWSSAGGRAMDTATDFMAASIIFARLGYIPKNIAQNLVMSVPHQGPFLLMNLPRAGQILADEDLRHLFGAEVGFSGATASIGQEFQGYGSRAAGLGRKTKGFPSSVAEFVGKFADTPFRVGAMVHELAAEGVIPRFSPILTEADKAKLITLLTDESQRPLLNDIRSRAVEAMADFSRLTPSQRKWSRRFLIIPGWLWAGSRYPIHFAATHPVRSAAIGYAAAGEPYADRAGLPQNPPITDLMAGGLPYYVEGIGGDSGKVLRTTSLSPVSTPWEIGHAALGSGPRTVGSYANPLVTSLWNIANKQAQGPYGSYSAGSYQEAAKRAGDRLAPNKPFFEDLISPDKDDPRYPEDATRWGRIKREAGVFPIEITRDKATGAKAKAAEQSQALSKAVNTYLPVQYRAAAQRDLRQASGRKGQVDEIRAKIQKDTDSGEPYYRAVFPAELDIAVKWKLITPKIAAERKKWANSADAAELEDEVRYFRDNILGEYNNTLNDIENALEHFGWKPSEG